MSRTACDRALVRRLALFTLACACACVGFASQADAQITKPTSSLSSNTVIFSTASMILALSIIA